MMRNNTKGFTLIELLVVIAIIGLLATLAVVSLNSARTRARDAKRKSDLNAIATAMELYNTQESAYQASAAACGAAGTTQIIESTTNTVCETNTVTAPTDSEVLLQSIPADPTNSGSNIYTGYSTTASYCISAPLEQSGTVFKCVNGSCFEGAACTSATG